MRSTIIAVLLMSCLPACGDPVTEALSSTGAGASGGSGGGAAGSTSGAGPRMSHVGKAGEAGAGVLESSFSPCAFTLTGAVNVTVDERDEADVWSGYVQCTGSAGATRWSFSFTPEMPGYVEVETDGADGTTVVEFEASTSAPCVLTYTTPLPLSPCDFGAPVAGTFSCDALVDEDDPTKLVTVQGSFDTFMSGSTECD